MTENMRNTASFDLDIIDSYSLEVKKKPKETSKRTKQQEEELNDMILRYVSS